MKSIVNRAIFLLSSIFVLCLIIACKSITAEPFQKKQVNKNTDSDSVITVSIFDTLQIVSKILQEEFPNHTYFNHKTGDLNQDQKWDIVIIAERSCNDGEDSVSDDSFCRTVILLLNVGKENFKIGAINDYLVDCSNCAGGDPHQNVNINKDLLIFESLYGDCDKTNQFISFKYEKSEKNWFLHEIETTDYGCREEDHKDGEVLTYTKKQTVKDFGRITFKEYKD